MTLEELLELGLEEEVANKVIEVYRTSIKDEYIPIARFNEVNEDKKALKTQLDDRDIQLGELKIKATGNEDLTTKIAELETLNTTTKTEYEEKIKVLRKETSIELALKDNKAKNIKAVKVLLDLEKVSLDGENLIGLDEQLETLKEKESYLFGTDTLKGRDPNPPGNPVDPLYKDNPFSKDTFNLTKQGELYRTDRELADKLKAAAK